MERATSSWITNWLHGFGEIRDTISEAVFLSTYGSTLIQALVGLGAPQPTPNRIERDLVREADVARLRSELENRFEAGGVQDAAIRALGYIRLPEHSIDERGFSALKLIRASRPLNQQMNLAQFKEMLRQQYLLVCLDEERAIATLPKLLGGDSTQRKAALEALRQVTSARGDMSDEGRRRLKRIETLFEVDTTKRSKTEAHHA
jgi:hypothetical protein